jgi:FkbM family methyltransferase
MVIHALKRTARRALGLAGFSIRGVGRGVSGIDLLHDARVLLSDPTNAILFDVGANVGQTTTAMLDAFRDPTIYAFEPSPTALPLLRRVVSGRSRVTLEPIALGESTGKCPFNVTADYSVNDSLLAPVWDARAKVVEVDVETIDNYCHRQGINAIDLLKIDAQGYDLHVLRGATRMLQERRIRLFCCEANFERMYVGQATLVDLLAFGSQIDYRFIGFYEQTFLNDRLAYVDLLYSAS